jgi:hypothetical protein
MVSSQLLPTGLVTRLIFRLDCPGRLLESECPKTAKISRFQSWTFPQVVKMLFTQTPKSADSQWPTTWCESETWLCVVQLIRKQSCSQMQHTQLTRNTRRQPQFWLPPSGQSYENQPMYLSLQNPYLMSNKNGHNSNVLYRVVPLRQQPYKFWRLLYFWHQPVTRPGVRDR